MNSQESTSLQTDLRKQAEEILQGKAAQSPEQLKALSPEALGALFHELYVHQIELELQNEELCQKQIELDIAKTRYFELYDLAPVAYLTLSKNGLIKQVNFAAQTLLGVSRRSLLNKPLSQFILQADYALYYTFHKQLVESLEQQVLDVRMLKKDGIQFWVHMEAITAQEEDEAPILRITLTNITELIKTEIALRESNVYIQSLVDSALDGVIGIDLDGRVISWNPQAVNIFGYSLKQALGREVAELIVPPAYQEAYRQSIVRFKNTGISTISNTRIEVMGMRSDRSEFPLELSISVIRQQESYFFSVFVRDITERKQTENTLSIAATVFESQEGIFITDANSLILRANQAVYTITGYSEKELAGKTPSLFHSGRQEEGFYTDMWKIIGKTGIWEGEIWNRRKNGEIYPEHLTISSVKDPNGNITNYVATFTDITQSQVAADKIKFLAFYDPLTQLPNRMLLRDRLTLAFISSQRNNHHCALLFMDLDNFKSLNDTLGHAMGDLLLQQVAERLVINVREGDTVARLGGDEFVVLLEDLSESINEALMQVEAVGKKILASINQNYQLNTYYYHCTSSIGITLFKGQKQTLDELLKQADIAMYQAKAAGRHRLRFFDQHMQDTISKRVGLERDLENASAENQFSLYYQPQVQCAHQIIGAEALIRWYHPQRGFVPPDVFIPLAEENGLILSIGHWVLETVCAQIKSWENGVISRDLIISVNVSARQFHEIDFVETVRRVLKYSGINPNRLKLELTETAVLDDIEDTIDKMNELHELGISFSMDDFGTGYSSLSYLSRLPMDQLKIDQSFVQNIGQKASDAVMVQTIIGMARNLGMQVIAEGVETEQQRDFLELNGCSQYQGYLFSKPVTIEQFELLLNKNSHK